MGLRVPAAMAGVLGGAGWLASAVTADARYWWAGLGLLLLACVTGGAALVRPEVRPLRWLVAVACPLLVACLWLLLRDAVGGSVVDPALGATAVVAGVVELRAAVRRWSLRRRRAREQHPHRSGRGMARHSA